MSDDNTATLKPMKSLNQREAHDSRIELQQIRNNEPSPLAKMPICITTEWRMQHTEKKKEKKKKKKKKKERERKRKEKDISLPEGCMQQAMPF